MLTNASQCVLSMNCASKVGALGECAFYERRFILKLLSRRSSRRPAWAGTSAARLGRRSVRRNPDDHHVFPGRRQTIGDPYRCLPTGRYDNSHDCILTHVGSAIGRASWGRRASRGDYRQSKRFFSRRTHEAIGSSHAAANGMREPPIGRDARPARRSSVLKNISRGCPRRRASLVLCVNPKAFGVHP